MLGAQPFVLGRPCCGVQAALLDIELKDPVNRDGLGLIDHKFAAVARVVIAAWAADCNTERPHSALDYQTPADDAPALTTAIARPAARD